LRALGVDLEQVEIVVAALARCFRSGGKVLLFGNGGSAADAQHLATELVGRFVLERPGLPALALTTDSSALTAIANDFGFEQVFARQVEALGRPGDVAVAISTSGASPNLLAAVEVARKIGLTTVALVGEGPSPLEKRVQLPIVIPSKQGQRIQEAQLVVEHALCGSVEEILFGAGSERLEISSDVAVKVVGWDQLERDRDAWREAGLKVVWTNGCFDLLHVGHLRSLEAAKKLGDKLVVGINGDASARALKGEGRPLMPAEERAQLVASLAPVDRVVVFEEATPEAALERLRPDVHAKGEDYADRPMPERAVVEAYGGVVELLPLVTGRSTTDLVRRLREQDGS
jgi:rfaE bifunctional protein nucleotidyltransferase chain/domain